MSLFPACAVALLCLVIGVNSSPTNSSLIAPPELQYEYKDELTGVMKPYVPFDSDDWHIDSSIYPGVPMIIKTSVIDGKSVKYQDFDLEKLSIQQLREYVFNGEEYLDSNNSHALQDEEIEHLRETFVSRDLGIKHRGFGTFPRHLVKKGGLDNVCWSEHSYWCSDQCSFRQTRTTVQSINRSVYGYYHYDDTEAICGPGTISKSVGKTHTASLRFSANIDLSGWGQGPLSQARSMLSAAGFGVGTVPDSVTTTITYSGTCNPNSRCELWFRPHFKVFKGVITLFKIAPDGRTHCEADQQSLWEAHTPVPKGENGGPYIHGICQRRNAPGCPRYVPNSMPFCP